jgi:hypothetical protein
MARKPFTNSVTGLVIGVKRHGHTINGNPIMSVTLSTPTEGYPGVATFRISNDSGLVYEIENPEYRDTPHIFDVTGAGRISGYTSTI